MNFTFAVLPGSRNFSVLFAHTTEQTTCFRISLPEVKVNMHNSRLPRRTIEVVVFWVVTPNRWLETNVSKVVLPPSSGLSFVIMGMYPLHHYLPRIP